jgi:hypothetical protein
VSHMLMVISTWHDDSTKVAAVWNRGDTRSTAHPETWSVYLCLFGRYLAFSRTRPAGSALPELKVYGLDYFEGTWAWYWGWTDDNITNDS